MLCCAPHMQNVRCIARDPPAGICYFTWRLMDLQYTLVKCDQGAYSGAPLGRNLCISPNLTSNISEMSRY